MTNSTGASVPVLLKPRSGPGRPLKPGFRPVSKGASATNIPRYYAWLFLSGVIMLLAYYNILNPNHSSAQTRLLATTALTLGCLPMIQFLFRGKFYQVPVLEAHGLFYALCFGFPGFLPIPKMSGAGIVSESSFDMGLIYTSAGLLALYFGYYVVGPKWMTFVKPVNLGDGLSRAAQENLAWIGCLFGGGLLFLGRKFELAWTLQIAGFVFNLGFYLLLILALEKRLSLVSRLMVILVAFPYQLVFNSGLTTGQLAGPVMLLCWISLVIMRCWRHIPVYLLAGAFLFFLIFQPVKFYVRSVVWNNDTKLGALELLKLYEEGFFQVYGSSGNMLANRKDNFEDSFARVNHLALFSCIIRDTPSSQPFLYGQTYLPLLVKPIPRFLWPDKPQETLGNRWAHRYGYLDENDSTTSFNLAWLPEMYMNGGAIGVVLVMFLVGLVFRNLWIAVMCYTPDSVTYAVALGFAQCMVFAENNLSLQFGGVIVSIMMLWLLRRNLKFFGIISQSRGPNSLTRRRVLSAKA